jgi:hypothetical protein
MTNKPITGLSPAELRLLRSVLTKEFKNLNITLQQLKTYGGEWSKEPRWRDRAAACRALKKRLKEGK